MKISYWSDALIIVPETQMEKDHMLRCVTGIDKERTRIDKEGTITIRFEMLYESKGFNT